MPGAEDAETVPQGDSDLDIRHAQEKLWQVGRLFYAEGSDELAAWVESLETLLYPGQIDELLGRLRQQWRGAPRHGPGTKARRESLRKAYGYLWKRVKLMAYGQWREQDLVIASGVVEGAARHVVGERLDNSGMRWIKQRAEAVLLLRCIESTGIGVPSGTGLDSKGVTPSARVRSCRFAARRPPNSRGLYDGF